MLQRLKEKWGELDKYEQNIYLGRFTGLAIWLVFTFTMVADYFRLFKLFETVNFSSIASAKIAELTYLNSIAFLGIFVIFTVHFTSKGFDFIGKHGISRIYDRFRGVN